MEKSRGLKPPVGMIRDELADITLEDWEAARIKYIKPTKEELKDYIIGFDPYIENDERNNTTD